MDPNDMRPIHGPPPVEVLSTSDSAAPSPEQESPEGSGNGNCESDSRLLPSQREAPFVFSRRLLTVMIERLRPMTMETASNEVFGGVPQDNAGANQGQGMISDENLTTVLTSILGHPRINDPAEEYESNEGNSSLNGQAESFEPESGNGEAVADGGNSPERSVGEPIEVTMNSQESQSSNFESADFEVDGDSVGSINEGRDKTTYDAKWMEMFDKLVSYKANHGNCFVMDSEDPDLARWVWEQRRSRLDLVLTTPMKLERLDEIGFVWNEKEAIWNHRLKKLIAYKQIHGDCNVPKGFAEYPQLGNWVKAQRTGYTKMMKGRPSLGMTEERVAILEGIGFVWNMKEACWNDRFRELAEFKKENGNFWVSRRKQPALHQWMWNMKNKLRDVAEGKQTTLTDDQINKLHEIGLSAQPKRSADEHVASGEPSNAEPTEPSPKRFKSGN